MTRFAPALLLLLLLPACAPRGSEVPPRPTPVAIPDSTNGEMVAVPAGEFLAGCDPATDRLCESDEKPARTETVGTFAIDVTEVTQGAYAACVRAGACTAPYHGPTPWDGEACVGRFDPAGRAAPGGRRASSAVGLAEREPVRARAAPGLAPRRLPVRSLA